MIWGERDYSEIIQGLLGIGAADIDDIILNVLGGWIGILVYKSLLFILRDGCEESTNCNRSSICDYRITCNLLLLIHNKNEILNCYMTRLQGQNLS
ncbi:VanZ family protein [Paenibacillus sp. NEAU-GSW1]|uniref:VanZ family protein n=1 Tax=Paenibacillus sp. NEAU-GSW1 TaxID=2682486 RepID=UPI0034649719